MYNLQTHHPRNHVRGQQRPLVPSDQRHRRAIAGGRPAELGEFSWFAVITGRQTCGGALIAPDIVLTAAHCASNELVPTKGRKLYNSLPRPDAPAEFVESPVIVGTLGLTDRDKPEESGQFRRVSDYLVHPQFDLSTLQYDIMLIRLSKPVHNVPTIAWDRANFDTTTVIDECYPTDKKYTSWALVLRTTTKSKPRNDS